jgi:molybdopterin-containing oxidoreductase family iron-sulfur binding subunit
MNDRKDLSPKLAEFQDRLALAHGKKYWRTLEELADSEAFRQLMQNEFPEQASLWPDSLSRRQFLTLMGASLALAGLTGCSVRPAPSRTIVPYVRQPEEVLPGRPLFFATAMTMGGVGVGLLAENHLGRPTKIEGNPDHPASLGATDVFHQASILGFYDPDRSQTVTLLGQTSTWDAALGDLPIQGVMPIRRAMDVQRKRMGNGLRLLTETVVSPTLHEQIKRLLQAFPQAKWHQYEPITPDAERRAALQAFGQPVNAIYDFTKADVVLCLDADFLACGPGNLRYTADFMSRRRVRTTIDDAAKAEMNRLYVIEPDLSNTGAKADHRLALRASEIDGFARSLAAQLGVIRKEEGAGPFAKWVSAIAKDLEQHRGRCIILAGSRQPAEVHLLAHALNQQLGNVNQTVRYIEPLEADSVDQLQSLRELVDDMNQGRVEFLVVLGGNPVYTAPTDLRFAERMQKVSVRVHLSQYQDETSRQCHWHLPEAHYLEAWGDTRAYDGTASIVQPLIEPPLYDGRSAHELLTALLDRRPTPGRQIVQGYWRRHWESRGRSGRFEDFWQSALHDGIVPDSKAPDTTVSLREGWHKDLSAKKELGAGQAGDFEIVFQADPTIYDGRFANNGWLQELPKPITTLTWDNAALMSPATARELGVALGRPEHGGEHGGYQMPVMELEVDGRKVEAPAWIVPGHADRCISVHLGYGRHYAGRVGGSPGNPVGFNAYTLRTSSTPWFATGLKVRRTDKTYVLACTQKHHLMENRAVVRAGTMEQFRNDPKFAAKPEQELEHAVATRARRPLTMYGPKPESERKWGMVIDLTACVGCKACVVACQAENNIPVVGKEQVSRGREMHWLRIDRYLSGTFEEPSEYHFQPVPCMHCEDAPCEYVCPVEATVHSADGLNEMIYQRCVGTRFCSNNCPYKVRRFNFLAYADFDTPTLRMQYNPNVTVRSRGVMEKCSYCVQRIRMGAIGAEKEGRPIRDGEILTACQAACPAQAIIFGDINDPNSKVKELKDSPLNYALLGDLNTFPRTTYLAAVRNPNPELER